MDRSSNTSLLPFPNKTVVEIVVPQNGDQCSDDRLLGALDPATPTSAEDFIDQKSEVVDAERHRSQETQLPRPRRHEPARRLTQARKNGDVQAPEFFTESGALPGGLPVGTRVRFERRLEHTAGQSINRSEFTQVAASYVFAAALMACTFLI